MRFFFCVAKLNHSKRVGGLKNLASVASFGLGVISETTLIVIALLAIITTIGMIS